ncbi:hypothetical protein OXIME_001398 [Oxyplasma meridianum]|uniref:CARDB domain-containing protein n=1 Tax=Oxyplasma meridianum TaxID=3073602 RepID=A0AAX4NIC9_9ARCH
MDKSTLIVLIGIFLITTPAALGSLQGPLAASIPQINSFYDFSSLSVGSIPVGNSWVDFKTVNNTPNFAYYIKSTSYGNALHIVSSSDSVRSYLDMQINYSMPVSLSFYFMWNDSSPKLYSFDHILFMEGGADAFEYSFGVKNDSMCSVFNTSRDGTVSSIVPMHNDIYKASASFDPSLGEMTFELRNENTGHISFPMFFNGITTEKNSNVSVLFGGLISAIYVYNITVEKNLDTELPENTAGNIQYISNYSIISSENRSYGGNQTHPFLDIPLNTVIYVLENGSIEGYNYFEHLSYIISRYTMGSFQYIETLQYGHTYEVLWFQNGSLIVQDIDTLTLAVENKTFSGDFSGFSSLIVSNTTILYNSSGYIYVINTSESGGILSTHILPDGYTVMTVSQGNDSLYFSSTDGMRIVDYKVGLPSLSFSVIGQNNLSNYWVKFKLVSYVEGNYGSMMEIRPDGFILDSDLLTPSGQVYYIPGGFSALSSGSSSTLLSNGTCTFILIGNRTYNTDVDLPSGIEAVYFSSNGTFGVDIAGDRITIYHVDADYFSDYHDRINRIAIYKDEGFIFNVTSFVPYTITSTLGNRTFITGEGDFLPFNLSAARSGDKVLKSLIHNIAGYSFYFNYSFIVDNGIPYVNITPSSGSYIPQNASFNVTVTDSVPVDYVNVTFLNQTKTYYDSSFVISPKLYNFTGVLNVTVFIKDDLDYNFTRYFVFNVMNETVNGFSWNLNSQNYLSSDNLSIKWVPVANTTEYSIKFSGDIEETFITQSDQLNVSLPNGNYSVVMHGQLRDGISIVLGISNITVITYRPEIIIQAENETYYSFHGNSPNSTFHMVVASNITSEIAVEGFLPDNTSFLSLHGNSRVQIAIGRNFTYSFNGIYRFLIRSQSQSGTLNSTVFSIRVNNTVPEFPSFPTTTYTNRTSIELPFNIAAGLDYSANITQNGILLKSESITGKIFNLSAGQGVYSIHFTAYSRSGNHASSQMVIYFYYNPPALSMHISNVKLVYSNFTSLNYEINDSVPLVNLTLHENNITEALPAANDSGTIRIDFAKNGNYSFFLTAVDRCGNFNSSKPENVSVKYYDRITGSDIRINIFGNSARLEGLEMGNYSHNLQFAWYLNGKYEGNSSTINLNLPYGYSNVTLIVYYNGKMLEVNKRVLVVGWIPEIAALVSVAGIFTMRTFRIRRKLKSGIDLVLNNRGKSVKEVVKAGKNMGIPGSAVKKAVWKLASAGEISFDRDLDNNLYIRKR